MKIAIANDHAGVEYKNILKKHLEEMGHQVINFGTDTCDSVDYPDYAKKVTNAIKNGTCDKGVLICGTGVGMSIAANKQKGIRASLCTDEYTAKLTRMHNDSNVLCLGARVIGSDLMLAIADSYFSTDFDENLGNGRHVRRINKLED